MTEHIIPTNVVVFQNEEFFISFVGRRSAEVEFLDFLMYAVTGQHEPKDESETALVIYDQTANEKGKRFLILYGDHREAYAKLVPDLDACIKYFVDHIDQMSHSSDRPPQTLS